MSASPIRVSRLNHVLGALVERLPGLAIRLGRLETRWYEDRLPEETPFRPIYVCGLARAGSTILLEKLAAHPDTATHIYRDFPLVHVPLWWNAFLDRAAAGEGTPVERYHRDRIMVTLSSPEAMEEMIWMSFFSGCHDGATTDVLDEATRNPDFETFYRSHIRKIRFLREGSRYLAKGNYNVTRMPYLLRLHPEARFIVPVRDPVAHVASLMKQHRLFCEEGARDPRVTDHMRRAGHDEFGPNRRPIHTGDEEAVQAIRALWAEGREIEGWARYWALIHGYVAHTLSTSEDVRKATLVVHYETLCSAPVETLRRIHDHAGLEASTATLEGLAENLSPPVYYTPPFDEAEVRLLRTITDGAETAIRTASTSLHAGRDGQTPFDKEGSGC